MLNLCITLCVLRSILNYVLHSVPKGCMLNYALHSVP